MAVTPLIARGTRQWEVPMHMSAYDARVMARYGNSVLIYAVLVVSSFAWMFIPA
jgi:hypothetical protein